MDEFYFEIAFETVNGSPVSKDLSTKLMAKAVSSIHGTLRAHEIETVGISYPEWQQSKFSGEESLGQRLLVCSTNLEDLMIVENFLDMGDFEAVGVIQRSEVREVPENADRVRFSRYRKKERMLKLEKKGLWTDKEKMIELKSIFKPSIIIQKSVKKKKQFHLEIHCDPCDSKEGVFNTYGMSSTHSVPVF